MTSPQGKTVICRVAINLPELAGVIYENIDNEFYWVLVEFPSLEMTKLVDQTIIESTFLYVINNLHNQLQSFGFGQAFNVDQFSLYSSGGLNHVLLCFAAGLIQMKVPIKLKYFAGLPAPTGGFPLGSCWDLSNPSSY